LRTSSPNVADYYPPYASTENPFGTLKKRETFLARRVSSSSASAKQQSMCRRLAFSDLWHRGFFLTDGAKFGADFLAYPGDPARYHAQNVVVCVGEGEGELQKVIKVRLPDIVR
jgi:tRNA splicing endonuclease